MSRIARFDASKNGASGNGRMALALAILVAIMAGLSFAAVPLYRIFCQKTGWAGTPQRATAAPRTIARETVTVRFDANVSPGLPWSFEPVKPEVTLHIGENTLAFFRAVNHSQETVTGSAVFNVSPDIMGQYFTKIQCFCFTEQTLKPGEAVEMPVSFYIDPAILEDRDAKTVRDMTLSYTFYKVQKPRREQAAAASRPHPAGNPAPFPAGDSGISRGEGILVPIDSRTAFRRQVRLSARSEWGANLPPAVQVQNPG
ncbi:MAG TPA: cytochrome c oxidase assembly protein [Rhodomicrobium sp.]|nr:cytochrome c oxidase assembly protein [Rhodomicrobium sp.]